MGQAEKNTALPLWYSCQKNAQLEASYMKTSLNTYILKKKVKAIWKTKLKESKTYAL